MGALRPATETSAVSQGRVLHRVGSCIPPIGATTLAVSSAAAQEDGSSGEDLELTDEEDAIQELSYAEFPDYNDPVGRDDYDVPMTHEDEDTNHLEPNEAMEEDLFDETTFDANSPVYNGSDLSNGQLLALLKAFSLRHGLSDFFVATATPCYRGELCVLRRRERLCRNGSYATLKFQAVLVKAMPSQDLMKQQELSYEYRLMSRWCQKWVSAPWRLRAEVQFFFVLFLQKKEEKKMKGWRDGCRDLEELLGRLEDQGWCLACGVYGHTVAVCPFQEEEEEPAQMRKVRRRRQRGGNVRRKQREPRWCTMCNAYGHEDKDCPEQEPEEEEPVCPLSGGEEPVCPLSGGEEPVRPVSGGEEPVRPVSGGEEPVRPVSGGEEPVRPVSGGEEPVRPVSGGEKLKCPVSGGEEPVRPVSGGEELVCPVSGGEEPVRPVSGGEELVCPVSGGEEPVRPVSGGEELKAQTPIFFWEGRGREAQAPQQPLFLLLKGAQRRRPPPALPPLSEEPAVPPALPPLSEEPAVPPALPPLSEEPAVPPALPPLSEEPAVPPALPPLSEEPAVPPALPPLSEEPALPGVARDPALPGVARDPALPGVARDPALPGVVRDPALPGVARDPALPGVVRDPALPGVTTLWPGPHGGELLAMKRGGEVRRPAPPAALSQPEIVWREPRKRELRP
ncbi:UNVERIFIED_CONTAM: hypothetical protein FKN15_074580 [Acipenser sinensis]